MKKRILALTLALCLAAAPAFAGFSGGGAFGDLVNYLKRVATNVVPSATNTYDLGSSTKVWRNLYVTGTVLTGNITVPTAGWVGLGAAKGRIVFTDAATDTINLTGGTTQIDEFEWTNGNTTYVPIGGDIATYITNATAGDTLQLAATPVGSPYTLTAQVVVSKKVHLKGQGIGITNIVCSTDNLSGLFAMSAAGSLVSDMSIAVSGAKTVSDEIFNISANCNFENLALSSSATGAVPYLCFINTANVNTVNVKNCSWTSTGAVTLNFMHSVSSGTATYNYRECVASCSGATQAQYGVCVVYMGSGSGYCNIYNSTLSNTAATAGGVVHTAGGTTRVYNSTLNGSGATSFDAKQTGGTLTLYNTTLVNGTTSGTITYGGTIATSGISSGTGTMNLTGVLAGSTYSVQKQHDEIGILLSNLTTPKAIVGFTGTGETTTTENGYESGAGRVWTYSGGLAADKIFQGSTYVYSFDGVDSYLNTPDTADMTFSTADTADTAFSIGGWVQVVAGTTIQTVFSKWDATTATPLREYYLAIDAAEKVELGQYDESADKTCTRLSDAAVAEGWHYIVVTQSGTGGATAMNTALIYVDGAVVASTAANDASYVAMENTTALPFIGAITSTAARGNFFNGDMGRISVTGEAFSASDVWKLYEQTKGFYNK